jgi:cytochrome c oxidase subunit 2
MEPSFRLVPHQASTLAPQVDGVFLFIILVSVFFSTLAAILLIFFAVRYRRRSDNFIPKPVLGSNRLEVTWLVIMLVLFLTMFYSGASVYFTSIRPPDDSMEVYVVGRQWMWKVQHPEGQREINELHVPVGKPVKLILTSEDVIHSFFIPDFRVKMDAVPGRYTYMWFQASKVGRYHLFCAQYCGTDHSRMTGWIVVQEPDEYERWLHDTADRSMALKGRGLFLKYQCITCHSANSQARAPVLEDLYLRRVPLTDGSTVIADDNYLRESILNPKAKIVAGYQPIMPPFAGQIDEAELQQVIAYIKSLRPGETPTRNEQTPPPDKGVPPPH